MTLKAYRWLSRWPDPPEIEEWTPGDEWGDAMLRMRQERRERILINILSILAGFAIGSMIVAALWMNGVLR